MGSPLLFILANELYLTTGSRNFLYGHSSSVSAALLLAVSLCFGLNFGLPPFLNFWVEVSLFSLQGYIFSLSLLPLILSAFLSFAYSVIFYVLRCGGPGSCSLSLVHSLFIYFPSIFFSFSLSFSPSLLLF